MLFPLRFHSAIRSLAPFVAVALLASPAAANDVPFFKWVEDFQTEARGEGISQKLLDKAFADLTPNERVIELDQSQPEGTMTFARYKERVVNQKRIDQGRELMVKHKSLLERVSQKYGVQPQYIVALWGIETNFGGNTGGFNIVEALASLAYDGRRSEFFRKELINALKIVDGGHIPLEKFKGSWAGAMGQCQFMPTSFMAYAQDGDGDGKKDIWTNLDDVFASIANYLSQSGWQGESTWGREVSVPAGFDRALGGTKTDGKTIAEWRKLGVKTASGETLPGADDTLAWLVYPGTVDESDTYLVYQNYRVVMKWNRSTFFATSVGMLADKLATAR